MMAQAVKKISVSSGLVVFTQSVSAVTHGLRVLFSLCCCTLFCCLCQLLTMCASVHVFSALSACALVTEEEPAASPAGLPLSVSC